MKPYPNFPFEDLDLVLGTIIELNKAPNWVDLTYHYLMNGEQLPKSIITEDLKEICDFFQEEGLISVMLTKDGIHTKPKSAAKRFLMDGGYSRLAANMQEEYVAEVEREELKTQVLRLQKKKLESENMIDELINRLTSGTISVDQALIQAKVISHRARDDEFSEWIDQELNGYKDKTSIPDYRYISCEVVAETNIGGVRETTILDMGSWDQQMNGVIYKIAVEKSIIQLQSWSEAGNSKGHLLEPFPSPLASEVQSAYDLIGLQQVGRRFHVLQIQNIVDTTSNILLDKLLMLERSTVDPETTAQPKKEYQEPSPQIVQNFYGDSFGNNVAVGNNISQSNTNEVNQNLEKLISELKGLGVPNEELNEVKEIIAKEPKESRGKKILGWLGKLSSKAVEIGIDNFPLIAEKLQGFS